MSTLKLNTDETTDSKAVKTIQELGTVTVKITGPIECGGVRYEVGQEVTMSRDDANFHSENGNCTIVK